MDPLSIGAAIAGFIAIVDPAVLFLKDIRDESGAKRRLGRLASQLADDLFSLSELLKHLQTLLTEGRLPENDYTKLFSQARRLCEKQGELSALKDEIKGFKEKYQGHLSAKWYDRIKHRSGWHYTKDEAAEKIGDLRERVVTVRNRLSDDMNKMHLESYTITRERFRYETQERMLDLLDWITSSLLHAPVRADLGRPEIPDDFIQSSKVYEQWVSDATWRLDCWGNPGSGKTYRSHAVLEDLSRPRADIEGQGVPVFSIFLQHNNKDHQLVADMICNLLRQAVEKNKDEKLRQEIQREWEDHRLTGTKSIPHLLARKLFYGYLARLPRSFLVIDALDEAGDHREYDFLDELSTLQSKGVCIFSTSRYDPSEGNVTICDRCKMVRGDLHWKCNECTGHKGGDYNLCYSCYKKYGHCRVPSHQLTLPNVVHVRAKLNVKQLEKYCAAVIDKELYSRSAAEEDHAVRQGRRARFQRWSEKLGADYFASVPAKISAAAQGVILFAQLYLDRLKAQVTIEGLDRAIKDLDEASVTNIDELYGGLYEDIIQLSIKIQDTKRARIATDALSFVHAAKDILTFDALSHALAIEAGDTNIGNIGKKTIDQQELREDTHGLLAIDEYGPTGDFPVQLYHRTLATYLEEQSSRIFPQAHLQIFNACLAYMSLDVFKEPLKSQKMLCEVLEEHPFAIYAALHLGTHAREALSNADSLDVQEILAKLTNFLRSSQRLECLMQIAWEARSSALYSWDVVGGVNALHYCSFHGLQDMIPALILAGADINAGDKYYGQTPLIYASRRGNTETVGALLNVELSETGHKLNIKLDPNVISRKSRTALMEAIENHHDSVVSLLVEHTQVDINICPSGSQGSPALVRACKSGQLQIVEKLLGRQDVQLNVRDGRGYTALSRAVIRKDVECVKQLLYHSASNEIAGIEIGEMEDDRKPLDWVTDYWINYQVKTEDILTITQLLLDRKAKVSSKAIQNVISYGMEGTFRLLLDADAINHTWTALNGWGVLHFAAKSGNIKILDLINDRQSIAGRYDINMTDDYGATPLHVACQNLSDQSTAVISWLLSHGADPEKQNDDGSNPLKVARRDPRSSLVKDVGLVFEKHVGPDKHKSNVPKTPFWMVVKFGSTDQIMKALKMPIESVDIQADPYTGDTAIHIAIEAQPPTILQAICDTGVIDVNEVNQWKQSGIHIALNQRSEECLQTLIKADADLNLRDIWDKSPLQQAILIGEWRLAVILIISDAAVSELELPREVLVEAVKRKSPKAVERILEAKVDVTARDPETGLTARQFADALRETVSQEFANALLRNQPPGTVITGPDFDARCDNSEGVIVMDRIISRLRDAEERTVSVSSEDEHSIDWDHVVALLHQDHPLDETEGAEESINDAIYPQTRVKASARSEPAHAESKETSQGHLSINNFRTKFYSEDHEEATRDLRDIRLPQHVGGDSNITITVVKVVSDRVGVALILMLGIISMTWLMLKYRHCECDKGVS